MGYIAILILGGGLIYYFVTHKNRSSSNKNIDLSISEEEWINPYYKLDRSIYDENIDEINIPDIIRKGRIQNKGKTLLNLHSQYFSILSTLQEDDFDNITEFLEMIDNSLIVIEPLIIYEKRKWGSFHIKSLPAIEKGLLYCSLLGNCEKLNDIQSIIDFFPDLNFYREEIHESIKFCNILPELMEFIKEKKGITVNDIKEKFVEDYYLIKNRMYYLSKIGKLKKSKIKNFNFYEIY